MKPIIIPIEDTLDLHTFNPRELPELVDDYLAACVEAGIWSVKIIHGKGQGILKTRLRNLLAKHPLVQSFKDAPPHAGGWGSTLVKLHDSSTRRR